MSAPEDRAAALDVERAIRDAARAGNRLLAGARVQLRLAPGRRRELLAGALARMGARILDAHGTGGRDDAAVRARTGIDVVFVDAAAEAEMAAEASAAAPDDVAAPDDALAASAVATDAPGALPPTIVRVPGGARPLRGADARARIDWASRGMPATAGLLAALREELGGRGIRLGVSLVLEPKTAAFAAALARAGCEVAVFSAVSETDPEVAAALAAEPGVVVFAPTEPVDAAAAGVDAAADAADLAADASAVDAAHAAAILDWAPEYLIDDGAHLIRLAHTERPSALATLRGASEETTSGVRPLREAAETGALRIPVIAANDARTKSDFDNLIGTGQSCVLAIADCLDPAGDARGDAGPDGDARGTDPAGDARPGIAGTRWAVIGYGPVGIGVARFAAALGAEVTVVERDPVRALSALHDGHEATTADAALARADIVVSATGVWHTIDAAGFARLRSGTAVAVAGGIDDELALDELRDAGWRSRPSTGRIAEWTAPDGRSVRILAEGSGVNYTAAEGNPIEVMDLSFATQVSALLRLVRADAAGRPLPAGVHALDRADEERVARAALAARGGGAEASPDGARPGGAAQEWTVHRYRRGN
ncbi:adenosylhomocysteinase [Leucobacter allii]|uniref:Adenosylhomocysteinase n=1 Tax=Leucobacter allii TaxID=2932247 RepID=A0ABY4FH66_9MICO|nr:adenosylhomocysteinase [Leucobacter allii]UOQ55843.1 adenosylhomocysteinase [Leucobacter allii]